MEKGKETLGMRLRRLRLSKGLTVEEIATEVGVAISTYREWEYGRSIRGEPYLKLADALEVSVYELLTGGGANQSKLYNEMEKIELHVKGLKAELSKAL